MAEHKFKRGSIAVLGAIVLGASVLLASGSAATAAPEEYDFGNIDGSKSASLTVHKYADQTSGATGDPDGTIRGSFTDPIQGVVFTAYPLLKGGDPVDLTTFDGWDGLEAAATAASGSTACAAPSGYTLGTTGIEVGPTDASGVATAALPVGAYIVCETSAPSTVTKRNNPFLVTLPYPVKAGTPSTDRGWLYDVHVYPKNTVGEFEKTIETQTELGVGSPVEFTVTGAIPDISPDDWTEFTVTDALDSRLDAVSPYATVSPAAAGAEVEYDSANHRVIVRFKNATWLKANPGEAFEIKVHTRVNAAGTTGIKNTAQQWVNNPALDPSGNPPTTTPEVVTNWGTATLKKVDTEDSGTGLAGAEFQVYAADPAYAASPGACSTTTAGSPITFNAGTATETDTIVSGAGGAVNVPALFVSDSVNPPANATFRCYVLVETQAPAGYVTPAGDAAKRALPIGIGANDFTSEPIENSQQAIPGLPLTGAQGQVLLILLGVAAAAVVVGLVPMNRRRQNAAL